MTDPGSGSTERRSRYRSLFYVLFVTVVLLVIVQYQARPETSPARATKPRTATTVDVEVRRLVAFDVCKDFVKRRLKSPSSAKFRNPLQDDGEVVITGSGTGPYTIVSTVDAENSFGAKPRSTFVCVVTLNGDTWNLDDLSIS